MNDLICLCDGYGQKIDIEFDRTIFQQLIQDATAENILDGPGYEPEQFCSDFGCAFFDVLF